MIRYTPEGYSPSIGLNITLGTWRKPWFSLRWVWYDPGTQIVTSKRIRVRFYMRPFILTSSDRFNAIENWLREHDCEIVSREKLHDLKSVENDQKARMDAMAIVQQTLRA